MITYFRILALGTVLIPDLASAQNDWYSRGPMEFPDYYPTAPLSGPGETRKNRTNHRLWDARDAQYRHEACRQYDLRQVRSLEAQIRNHIRHQRTEAARASNLSRGRAHQEQTAVQATALLNDIRQGTVRWPRALQRGLTGNCLNEAAAIMRQAEPTAAGRQRLVEIVDILNREVHSGLSGSSFDERLKAHRMFKCLEFLTSHPDLWGAYSATASTAQLDTRDQRPR
jgi:hypothetical protein